MIPNLLLLIGKLNTVQEKCEKHLVALHSFFRVQKNYPHNHRLCLTWVTHHNSLATDKPVALGFPLEWGIKIPLINDIVTKYT